MGAVVYVREQRAEVRKRGGRLVVEKEKQELLEIPLRQTEAVAVYGNVQVTTQALSELLERGIALTFYTMNGRLKGRLVGELSKNVELRVTQYEWRRDEGKRLEIAREVVAAKLWNSGEVLADYGINYGMGLVREDVDRLRQASQSAERAGSLAELLGLEGSGAARYFGAFGRLNRSELPFAGRVKHPATDPVNALLSLGYTMVMGEIRALVEGVGLEPHLGFLHGVDYGRPSLALDLMEPFRAAVVDRLTLRLINERVFTGEDFARRVGGTRDGSVILHPDSFRHYLGWYEKALREERATARRGMREEMSGQVERLCRALREEAGWRAYWEERDAVADFL